MRFLMIIDNMKVVLRWEYLYNKDVLLHINTCIGNIKLPVHVICIFLSTS